MKKTFELFLCYYLATFSVQIFAAPVAMVMDLNGNISINGETPNLLAELDVNSEVKLAKNATITLIYLSTGTEYVLNGPARANIGENKIISPNKILKRDMEIASLSGIATTKFSRAAIVMRAKDNTKPSILIVSPNSSKILSANPTFQWKAPAEGFQYRIEIFSGQEDSLYVVETTKTSINYPKHLNLPRNELLSWEIEASKGQTVIYNMAEFTVANNDEKEIVENLRPVKGASFSEILLFAWSIDNRGFKHEAQKYWQALAKLRPNNPIIKAKLR